MRKLEKRACGKQGRIKDFVLGDESQRGGLGSDGFAVLLKVALGACFVLKLGKEYLLLFTYLITFGKDVTLPLITKFKTNRPLSNLFVNRILN